MIRAAVVNIPVGNFRPELLSAGHAIIHDKIVAIDPCDAENCAVIAGSHNLGYRASYCNDDNLLIVRAATGRWPSPTQYTYWTSTTTTCSERASSRTCASS